MSTTISGNQTFPGMKKTVIRNGEMEVLEGTPAEFVEIERLRAKPGTNPLRPQSPMPHVQIFSPQKRCVVDGLGAGVHGIVCSCPRCAPTCSTTVGPAPNTWMTS